MKSTVFHISAHVISYVNKLLLWKQILLSMAVAPNFPVCQPLSDLEVSNGGYDDQLFLDPAPESLQCPVCLLVLRDPHLLSCCGAHICQVEIIIIYNYDL